MCHQYFLLVRQMQLKVDFTVKTTVKPVLRGRHWGEKKWPYKKGDLLREI
jgi:hypothetical protein